MRNEKSATVQRERSSTILLVAIVMLFIAARLWRLTSTCLWFDEIFSVHAARSSWPELFRFVAADIIHPPLFYVLLKLWITVGGESLLWLRLLPALLVVAAVAPFVLLCRELNLSWSARNFGLLLMAGNGYLIKYAQELRMYSLLLLLSTASLWLFSKVLKSPRSSMRRFFCLFLINFAMVYSHYAGWLMVFVEALVLIIWNRQAAKKFFIGALILVVAYCPWLYLILRSDLANGLRQNIGWMARPTLRDLVQFYSLLNKPFWFVQSNVAQSHDLLTSVAALLTLGIPLIALLLRIWRSRDVVDQHQLLQALSLIAGAPILTAFVFSWVLPESVWGTRHLIIVAAPYFILVAVAIDRLRQHWIRLSLFAITASWFALAGATWMFSHPPVYSWCAWEPLAQTVAFEKSPARIYAFEDLVAYQLWFALNLPPENHFNISVIKNVGVQEDPAYFLPRRFNGIATINPDQISEDDIWIAYRAVSFDETRPPLSALQSKGYEVVEKRLQQAQGEQAFMVHLVRNR